MAIAITTLIAILALAGGAAFTAKQVKDISENNAANDNPGPFSDILGTGGGSMLSLLPLMMMFMMFKNNKSQGDDDTYIIINEDEDGVVVQ
jgi:hypothetical protein